MYIHIHTHIHIYIHVLIHVCKANKKWIAALLEVECTGKTGEMMKSMVKIGPLPFLSTRIICLFHGCIYFTLLFLIIL
jgi:hypothetical protein